jgi:hypothetical protein
MSEENCETVKILFKAIRNKRRGMLKSGVVLHDNARPHTAPLLEHFNWELSDHTSYSPDLAPKRLPRVYLPEELVGITALQQ